MQLYQEVHWSGNSLKRHHRVGFIIKIDPNVELIQVEYPNARIIVFHAKVYRCLLKVINGYAPTEENSIVPKMYFTKLSVNNFWIFQQNIKSSVLVISTQQPQRHRIILLSEGTVSSKI